MILLYIEMNCMVMWFNLDADDMEIAPDFFDYFEAAAALLDKDKYVSLWNQTLILRILKV